MIDTDQRLTEVVQRLQTAEWIALDTEADSLHAYPEKVCLIQVSLPGEDVLIDPLARIELRPFWNVLLGRRLIMHGADYDLRMLRKSFGFVPASVFDTMLAARLLGVQEFGLASLAASFLGVTLEKGSQRADWARRPLTERMESYARNDTRYLKALADALQAQLEEKGRAFWHEEACARLVADCALPAPPDPEEVWRVKGSHRLTRAALAVLRELWHWREKEALAANRPPYFILSHEKLVEIADAAADSRSFQALLPRRFSERRRKELQNAIRKGLALPHEEQPHFIRTRSQRPTQQETERFSGLEARRNQHAAALGLDPALIASRSTLALLARNRDVYEKELMTWQRELLLDDGADRQEKSGRRPGKA